MSQVLNNQVPLQKEPTIIDCALARQMYSRMAEGIIYTLGDRAEMKHNRYTRQYELLIYNDQVEDMELVVSSRDGMYVALVGLLNCAADGWVERRLSDIGKGDAKAPAARTQSEATATMHRFSDEDEANRFYAFARRLRWTVSQPFADRRGDWFVAQIEHPR